MRASHKKWPSTLILTTFFAASIACHRAGDSTAEDGGTAANAVGIAECDEYLAKYARCIADKAPADRRQTLEDSLERTRATWKALAANPGARPGLPQACGLARQTAQSTLKAYACSW